MSPPHSSNDYRRATDLNGPWQFVTDPEGRGRDEEWYDPERWPDGSSAVEVPRAWQEYEAYRDYAGTAWYRRTVDLELPADDRVLIRFGAVDYEATVWVNGERVGSHRGGYLPFEIDATDTLVDGENAIVVEVVDPADLREIPHGKQGAPWYRRVSGIWQDVTLETVPRTRVDAVRITPDLERDAAEIDVDAVGTNAVGGSTVDVTVDVRRDGEAVGTAGTTIDADGSGAVTIAIDDPDYWTPETPALYDVRVDLECEGTVVDRYEEYFGMRSVESRNGRLYLNGEPYRIRGVLDQGYYPETLYRPFRDDLFEEEVRTAKELGFNLIRKHIKPAHPAFLECADRLGVLVWEEPANPTVHSERSKREVREQLYGMIDRDYNRPSVVVWSLYNEEWGIGNPQGLDEETSLWEDETKQAYLAELYEEIRAADSTRLVCDNSGWAHVATDVNDYHRYFVSPDRADAWEADLDRTLARPADNYAATETDPREAPIVVSEFGTWGMCDAPAIESYYGGRPPWFDHDFVTEGLKRPAGYRDRFEETPLTEAFADHSALAEAWQRRQFRSIADVIRRMRARDGIAGYVVTQFSDVEWEFNGILDYRREEKVFHDSFARVNAPVAVQLDPQSRILRDDETLEADVVIVNDTSERLESEVSWTAFGESGRRTVAVEPASVTRIDGLLAVDAPAVDDLSRERVSVTFGHLAATDESVTVWPRNRSPFVRASVGEGVCSEFGTVYVDDDALRRSLDRRGASAVDRLDESVTVAVVTAITDEVLEYADAGGEVLLVADRDGTVADESVFEYRTLPEDESWNLVASLFYAVDDRLASLVGTVPGWELDGLYPYAVAAVSGADDVGIGCVEGWLANPSAAIAARPYGEGTVRVCTLRVLDAYGDHPTATALVDALLTEASPSTAVDEADVAE